MSLTATDVVICPVNDILLDTGVGALIDRQPVAVFRLSGLDGGPDEVYCIDGVDPFTGVPSLARGIVGSAGDAPIVAAPLYKQRFDLRTGQCLDDEAVQLQTYPTRIVDAMVVVETPTDPFSR